MITEQDLQSAIAECQGKRDPNAQDCIKLAAFYTIKEHLYPEVRESFTYSPPPPITEETYESDSDFMRAVSGMKQADVMRVMDELMDTLSVINPRLYNGVMSKL